jgi:hypothetical protein
MEVNENGANMFQRRQLSSEEHNVSNEFLEF